MEYRKVRKEVNQWLKKHKYSEVRKVARPNPYPWHFWSAKFSTYTSIAFLKLGVTPNQITVAWFLLGIISSFFLWPGSLLFGIIFVVLYNLTWHLDFVDGDMARIISHVCPKYKQNVMGAWLDKFAYSTHKSFVLLGLGVGVFSLTGSIWALVAGFSAAYLLVWDNLMKVRVVEMLANKKKFDLIESPIEYGSRKSFVKTVIVPLVRPEPVSILTLAVLLGVMQIALYFYLAMYSAYFLVSFVKITKGLGKVYR